MKLVSWNVNGIRACLKKGFLDFFNEIDADIFCIQETKASESQVEINTPGYKQFWNSAEKKGYSGVATWSKKPFTEVGRGTGTTLDPDDLEGRMLHTYHDGVHCLNCYLPSGSSKIERQLWKEQWMEDLLEWARPFTKLDEPVFLCGDLNIAHTEDDIWNPVGNKNMSGFLPQEREWFDRLLASGWNDLLRISVGPGKGPYSWWSNRGQAREKDRGWRIDYVLGNAAAAPLLKQASVMREGGLVVSDHAPVIVDLDF